MLSHGLVMLIMAGCSQADGCGCGEAAEYPVTGLKVDQGLQVRLSQEGIGTLEQAVLPLISEQLGGGSAGGSAIGFCLPETRGDQDICFTGETCDDGTRGCQITLNIESISIKPADNGAGTVTESDAGNPDGIAVEVRIDDFIVSGNKIDPDTGDPDGTYDALSLAAFSLPWLGYESCQASIGLDQDDNGNNRPIGFELALDLVIDSNDQERLALRQGDAGLLDSDNLNIGLSGGLGSGCNAAGALIGLAEGLIIGQIEPLFTPQITSALDGFLCTACDAGCPAGSTCDNDRGVCVYDGSEECVSAPIGAEGKFNAGELLSDFGGGLDAEIFYSIYPATYADVANGGISLAVRTGATAEHNSCVPYQDPPSADPVPRSTQLEAATSPNGSTFDAGIGISERFLEHAMWGVYTSGTLCIEISSKDIPQLSSGALSLFMQSLGNLTNGEARSALIQLFPKRAPTVRIGEGTFIENADGTLELDDPLLTIELYDLDINFYVYAYDRYTRIFTVNTDIELPLGLTLTAEGELLPIAGDLATGIKRLEVRNSELISEDPATLENILPSLLAGFLPSLTEGISQPIALPDLMGFQLTVEEMTGIENNTMIGLFAGLDYAAPGSLGFAAETRATLEQLELPVTRYTRPDGSLDWQRLDVPMAALYPRATLNLSGAAPAGKDSALEYSYSVDGGLWSPFTPNERITIQHPALLLQGKHTIDVRARAQGDHRSLDPVPERIELLVDWTQPVIEDLALVRGGEGVEVDAFDTLSDASNLTYRFRVNRDTWTEWGTLPSVDLTPWSGNRVKLDVEVRDASGNVAHRYRGVNVPGMGGGHPDGPSSISDAPASPEVGGGCSVSPASSSGGAPLGGALLLLAGALFALRSRRDALGLAVTLLALTLLAAACDDDAGENSLVGTCPEGCPVGEVCANGVCVPACESDSECQEGQICVDDDGDGVKTCAFVSCTDVSECGEVTCADGKQPKCFEGNCICEAPCKDGCPDGQFCCNEQDSCQELPDACAGLDCEPGFVAEVQDPATGDVNTCETTDGTCECVELPPLDFGRAGEYSNIDAGAGVIAVSAYNRTYGDLIVGVTATDGGEITWHFVDGVPADAPIAGSLNGPREGIAEKGPKVGTHTDIAVDDASGVIHVSYRDVDNDNLLYIRGEPGGGDYTWTRHTIDAATSSGHWTSISLNASGVPTIAYATLADDNGDSLLRLAVAASATPGADTDWTLSTLASAPPLAEPPEITDWPHAVALHIATTRYSDDRLAIAYYDATAGNLALIREESAGVFADPVILDGEAPDGTDTGVTGQWPSITIDGDDNEHLAYMDWSDKDLIYLNLGASTGDVVDGGERVDPYGPSFNYVGSDASITLAADGLPAIAYMDSTMNQLVFSKLRDDGVWPVTVLAGEGRDDAYTGAYGYYADHVIIDGTSYIASFTVNQQVRPGVFTPELTLHPIP